MRFLFLLLVAAGMVPLYAARAQQGSGEFRATDATQQVAVTFAGHVREPDARALLRSLGYRIEKSAFRSVFLWAAADTLLTPEEMARLRAIPGVLHVDQEDARAMREYYLQQLDRPVRMDFRPISVYDPRFTTRSLSRYNVYVTFESYMTEAMARTAAAQIRGLFVRKVTKLSNEIVVWVSSSWSSEAIRWLEGQALVERVAFVLR